MIATRIEKVIEVYLTTKRSFIYMVLMWSQVKPINCISKLHNKCIVRISLLE